MKIGISRYSHLEEPVEVLQAAERHGFDGVQLKECQYRPLGLTADAFRSEYGDLAQLACGGIIGYPKGDLSTWNEFISPLIPYAGEIGAGHICLCCGGVSRDGDMNEKRKTVAGILNELGQKAVDAGVEISMHNHAGSIWETRDDILRFADCINPKYVGLTIDTGHCAKGGIEDVAGIVKEVKEYLVNVHLKDMDASGQFCVLGTGQVDLRPVIDVLGEIGYDKWLIVDEESKNTPIDEAFDSSMEYLKNG